MPLTTQDIEKIRQDFPLLDQDVYGKRLVYFDNASTTQKPKLMIDAIARYYSHDNANVNRGVHALSVRSTAQYEAARSKVQQWINAPYAHECIFVRGTTEAINLVAHSYALPTFGPGDEILITHMEHHANIVPWQLVCEKTGATLQVAPISMDGELLLDEFEKKLSDKTKLVAVTYASNALGTINPVKQLIDMAHGYGAVVLLDGAQATAHLPIDVQALDCDFYVFSAHKMYGPTGLGVLWGRERLLNQMPPYQGGGEMIRSVRFDKTEYAPLPHKFEAGTPNISGVIGFGASLDYLASLEMSAIAAYEKDLLDYATKSIQALKGYRILGNVANKVPVISLLHESVHAHDIGTILDSQGIAMRSGHHCAMPLMAFFGVPATTRLSLSFYNTYAEIDQCMHALNYVSEVFS
jgi:cysteine desulfurase/selenocysteine lyase